MAEGFDLSDIPLICDMQSDVDSASELQWNSGNSQSQNDSRNSDLNLSNGNIFQEKLTPFQRSDICHANSPKEDLKYYNKGRDNSINKAKDETEENNLKNSELEEKYNKRNRTDEEMVLREFDLLDEVGPFNENDKNNTFSDNEYEYEEDDDDDDDDDCYDLSEDEIDAMLEEKLTHLEPAMKKPRLEEHVESENTDTVNNETKEEEGDDEDYVKKEKIVMVEKVRNHFEVLPDGWVIITHNSGVPLYLHKATRVCTLSKPYCLGNGSARKHAVPLSAVPCLEYRRAKEEEERDKTKNEADKAVILINGKEIPNARIETAQENESSRQLTPEQLNEYCKKLYEFETIQVFKFKSWLARRKYKKKIGKMQERPTLPQGTKLITCHIKQSNGYGKSGTREWIMNPNGKSYVCILHEYVQRVLKDQPVYTFKELEFEAKQAVIPRSTVNVRPCSPPVGIPIDEISKIRDSLLSLKSEAEFPIYLIHKYSGQATDRARDFEHITALIENTATPYLATVNIGKIQYGNGLGSSKKQAKHDAAKATLEILIPEMKEKIEQDEKLLGHVGNNRRSADLSFFDGIKIEDPRVTELCAKTTEPLPHEVLLICLQRNFGQSQLNIKYETTALKHCKNEFKMTVGNHTAKVICRNKRDGKQRAAQAILQALHPHVPSWGSLLRLYGNTSVKTVKEKKQEEQEITLLQNRGNSHTPNYAILNKLKEEMRKFKAMRNAVKPIGKFIPPDDVELPTESGSDLRNVVI